MDSLWGNLPRYGEFEVAGAKAKKPRLLGEGSFGKTYEAYRADKFLGSEVKEWVALKVLNPALLKTEEKRSQFRQEVAVLLKLKHQNVIRYVRGGQEGDEVYYAMELCMGGDLRKLVARHGPLPEKVVALVGAQVAAGLRHVHENHGLVHRDIKPENIVLGDAISPTCSHHELAEYFEKDEGLCRIVDFGLVNFEVDIQEGGRPFAGSPMYASPEQLKRGEIDQTTDIYSLGMSLLYLLKGRGPLLKPDGGDFKSVGSVYGYKMSGEDHDADIPTGVSPEFRSVLLGMIRKEPRERFTATDTQSAIREFLSSRLTVLRKRGGLDDTYELSTPIAPGTQTQSWVAKRKDGDGTEVRLTLASRLGCAGAPPNPGLRGREICEVAQRSLDPRLPKTFLRVQRVVQTDDALAFEEENVSAVPLSEVVRARSARKMNMTVAEALVILRPIAEAFDFLRSRVIVGCEDIFLVAEKNGNPVRVPPDRPLNEWPDLQVRISFMREALTAEEEASDRTVEDSAAIPSTHLHPVPSFCRLLYRLLTWAEVDAAAHYGRMAYTPVARLNALSNNYLRDLLCESEPWTTAVECLKRICAFETVPWNDHRPVAPPPPPEPTPAAGSGLEATLTGSDSEEPGLPLPSDLGASIFDTIVAGTAPPTAPPEVPRAAPPSPSRKLTAPRPANLSKSGSASASSASRSGPASGSDAPAGGASVARGSGSIPSATDYGPDETPTCEVVRPGVVISPFDEQQREQTIAPENWKRGNTVQCCHTLRFFSLPSILDPLVCRVLEPKWVESPYDPGKRLEVPWHKWVPNGELVCRKVGIRFRLPATLPYPEAKLLPEPGTVASPYHSADALTIPPESWNPGTWIDCPSTGMPFTLPDPLPPLLALADPAQPGILRSPYAPAAAIKVEPANWIAGLEVECPASHKMLATPPEVEQWEIAVTLFDGARRLVRDPFNAGGVVEVPASLWRSGGVFPHPATGRQMVLPEVPLLFGEINPEQPGAIRSPFTGQWFHLPASEWHEGATVSCPVTRGEFRLPEKLPEFPKEAKVGEQPGTVISPYDGTLISIPAAYWKPGQTIECDVTGRRFLLPRNLPQLVGTTDPDRVGWVYSPHSEEWQKVSFECWLPRNTVKCNRTGLPFKLPDPLPEWLLETLWVPHQPGRVKSPHDSTAEFDVAPADWKSGGILTCPTTRRRFRLPVADDFPTLELEKEVVLFGARWPDKVAMHAADELSRPGRQVAYGTVQSIWHRHQLSSVEQRRKFRDELFPPRPPTPLAPLPAPVRQPAPPPVVPVAPPARPVPYLRYAAGLVGLIGLAAWGLSTRNPPPPPPNTPGSAGFTFKNTPLPSQPDHLELIYNRQEFPITVERAKSSGFLQASVPKILAENSLLKTQLRAPGWFADCSLKSDGKGNFAPESPVEWVRSTAPLYIATGNTDYDKVVATWTRSLPTEPGTTPPAKPIEYSLGQPAEPPQLPTGIYKVTMEGASGSTRVVPYPIAYDIAITRDGAQTVQVPRSLAGEFWGFWAVDILNKKDLPATFLTFRVKPKAAGLTVDELEIPRGPATSNKEFRADDKRPMVGATQIIEDVKLLKPTQLAFRMPIEELEYDVVFDSHESTQRLIISVGKHKSASEIAAMKERRLANFNPQVQQVKEKRLWNMYREEDARNLEAGKVELLGRYPRLNDLKQFTAHYESRFKLLSDWSANSGHEITIELYPISSVLYPNPPHAELFDVTPTHP